MTSWIRLNKFQNPIRIIHNTDLNPGLSVKLVFKLAKLMIGITSKIYEPQIYNTVIYDLLYGNR